MSNLALFLCLAFFSLSLATEHQAVPRISQIGNGFYHASDSFVISGLDIGMF